MPCCTTRRPAGRTRRSRASRRTRCGSASSTPRSRRRRCSASSTATRRPIPSTLVIWEGQFGDFVNGAQVIIDQFITSGEAKWGRVSGITLFLPHGYEGQGPEHSSARLERFLQLSAELNHQVCVPSTPAQMFHMLRRQMLRALRKPLIVMTPKSLLRHKLSVSAMADLSEGRFQPVIDELDAARCRQGAAHRVLQRQGVLTTCSSGAAPTQGREVALVRIEELYPFPADEYQAILDRYAERARDRLVPGRAAEPGRLVPDPPSPAGAARRPAQPALRRSRGRCGARHRPSCQSPARAGSARRRRTDPEEAMTTEVRVPQLPESVADATLVAWHKKAGDSVARDENLADLETDKVVLEVPAPVAGVIKSLDKAAGATVTSGELLAVIEDRRERGCEARQGEPAKAREAGTRSRRRRLRPRRDEERGGAGKAVACRAPPGRGKQAAPRTRSRAAGATGASPRATSRSTWNPRRRPGRRRGGRARRPARADVAAAGAHRAAAGRSAIDRRAPDDLQRSRHAGPDGTARPLQGCVRKAPRRAARLHVVLRQGLHRGAAALPGGQCLGRGQRHRLSTSTTTSASPSPPTAG